MLVHNVQHSCTMFTITLRALATHERRLAMKTQHFRNSALVAQNLRFAKRSISQALGPALLEQLRELTRNSSLSLKCGDLLLLTGGWYVTHTGLLRLAARKRCTGIQVQPIPEFSDARNARYAFKATVYKSRTCQGFVGHGDADPFNVSPLFHGAEMRVAETRAVNRALRKAYGIGICSVEEIGSFSGPGEPTSELKRLPPRSASANGRSNGSPRVRDHLCQIIRQHQLDPVLVKSYAVDFCGTKTLREATREQVENFVAHLANWAEKDRNALLCQLNSYLGVKDGAA
jgi:hypothetical protein